MASITKRVDPAVEPGKRYQFWLSSENADDGTAIAQGDVFMIEKSLGRSARTILIETSPAYTDLSIRFNSQITQYKLRNTRLNSPVPEKDLENPIVRTDDSMTAIPIDAGITWTISDVITISDIQIVGWTTGTFKLTVF